MNITKIDKAICFGELLKLFPGDYVIDFYFYYWDTVNDDYDSIDEIEKGWILDDEVSYVGEIEDYSEFMSGYDDINLELEINPEDIEIDHEKKHVKVEYYSPPEN